LDNVRGPRLTIRLVRAAGAGEVADVRAVERPRRALAVGALMVIPELMQNPAAMRITNIAMTRRRQRSLSWTGG
jgi:hypothetical protein